MADNQELREFLIYAAKNGYADDNAEKIREPNGSVSIKIAHGDWLAHDNYFTSEDGRRFHGGMVAFLADHAMWYCGYSGFVNEHADPAKVYGFLKKAMLLPEPDFPVRGPWHLSEDSMVYELAKMNVNATLGRFEAVETITDQGRDAYEGVFYGGKID